MLMIYGFVSKLSNSYFTCVCESVNKLILTIIFLFSMAEEEPSDQKKYLEDSCQPKCVEPLLEYKACVQRIEGDDSGHKHCTGQYFDYWQCVDKCVAPKLLVTLK
ncbi:Cytochrome b-c1 complex subunit 6 [Heracleum sosnowskyi]|uniref:Complex III subunit VI n=1 Tax=Heracleum sosnowskyi TaxID=360622 RepID=A0AAD8HN15_9APIA|nr:Cytochrome b-c1 complex subunit 6 [Heracleum sosnowskyi]